MSSSTRSKRVAAIVIITLLSIVTVYGARSISYPSQITPEQNHGTLRSIASDGWVTSESKIILKQLLGRGNKLELDFNHWRPLDAPPARITVSVCGSKASSFEVTQSAHKHSVYLTGDCSPRVVSFTVHNPIQVEESRALGAQLRSATVSSKLFFPLTKPAASLFLIAVVAALSLLVLFIASGVSAACITTLISSYIIAQSDFFYTDSLLTLFLFFALIAIGGWYGRTQLWRARLHRAYNNKLEYFLIITILIIAACLRINGLEFGLPEHYHSDEPRKVQIIARMVEQGTWDPDYFLHPTLLLYLSSFMSMLFIKLGFWDSLGGNLYFLAGRSVSCVAGILSVYILFLIAKRIITQRAALIAALLFALNPLHITCSRYLKEDALLVLFLLATLLFVVRALQEDKPKLLLLAGLLAGLSFGSKYTGMLSAGLIAIAPFIYSRSWKPNWLYLKWGLLAALPFFIGFLLCTPYALLNNEKFITDFMYERRHMSQGHSVSIDAWSRHWMFHFRRSILPAFTPIIGSLAILSLVVKVSIRQEAVTKLRKNFSTAPVSPGVSQGGCGGDGLRSSSEGVPLSTTLWYLLTFTCILFYLPAEWVKAKPAPQPERYILPCIPILTIALAGFLSTIKSKKLATLITVFTIASVGYATLTRTVSIKYDTREQMRDWMVEHLDPNAKVLVNGGPYSPLLTETSFEVDLLVRNKPNTFELERLRKSGSTYVLLSSFVYDRYLSDGPTLKGSKKEGLRKFFRARFKEIFSEFELVKEVKPRWNSYGFHNPILKLYKIK